MRACAESSGSGLDQTKRDKNGHYAAIPGGIPASHEYDRHESTRSACRGRSDGTEQAANPPFRCAAAAP